MLILTNLLSLNGWVCQITTIHSRDQFATNTPPKRRVHNEYNGLMRNDNFTGNRKMLIKMLPNCFDILVVLLGELLERLLTMGVVDIRSCNPGLCMSPNTAPLTSACVTFEALPVSSFALLFYFFRITKDALFFSRQQ